jgi:hypothetical protein
MRIRIYFEKRRGIVANEMGRWRKEYKDEEGMKRSGEVQDADDREEKEGKNTERVRKRERKRSKNTS